MLISKEKKIIIFLITIIIIVGNCLFNNSYAIVSKTNEFYINDSANIISNETENYIINVNKKLYKQTGAQIVVVTVNNLENKSIEEYAIELFRSYKIGDKEKNNGILFLVAVEERKTRIEVGYGLEGRITDGKSGRILDDYVIPYFKDNKWDDGIINGFNAILAETTEEYGVVIDDVNLPINYSNLNDEYKDSEFIFTAIIIYVICSIVGIFLRHHLLIKWSIGIRNGYYCNNDKLVYISKL